MKKQSASWNLYWCLRTGMTRFVKKNIFLNWLLFSSIYKRNFSFSDHCGWCSTAIPNSIFYTLHSPNIWSAAYIWLAACGELPSNNNPLHKVQIIGVSLCSSITLVVKYQFLGCKLDYFCEKVKRFQDTFILVIKKCKGWPK